ncbi:unnamed protein product [Protopolystoma xenopodis]|uniref:Uncharacterized protein n=1 Tax=Protopolystoma xenopodis TaxID=117903 RepID=A0A448WUB6_9PLAT|nr:unnamed protein product [Protopolystoma xenopodis]
MKSSTELDSEKLMLSTSPDIIGFGLSEAELSVGARQIFSDSLLQYKTDIFNNHPDSREKCGESFRHTQSESEENEEEERDTKKPLLPKITNVRQSRYFSIQPASDIPSTPRWIKHRTSTSEAMPAQSTMNENLHELVVGLEDDSTLHNRSGAGPLKLATEQTQLHETGTGACRVTVQPVGNLARTENG